MKFKKIEIAIIIGLIASIIFNVSSFSASCRKVEGKVLRLHILANSDSEEDQSLKLAVRDAVIKSGYDIFDGAQSLTQAKEKIALNLKEIKSIATKTLRERGCNYEVCVKFEKAFFETRRYEAFTLPAGMYEALKIIIGKGEGHNWWCVMFPPLCLSAAAQKEGLESMENDEKSLLTSNPDYEIRFKCVEIYEKIKNKIEN